MVITDLYKYVDPNDIIYQDEEEMVLKFDKNSRYFKSKWRFFVDNGFENRGWGLRLIKEKYLFVNDAWIKIHLFKKNMEINYIAFSDVSSMFLLSIMRSPEAYKSTIKSL